MPTSLGIAEVVPEPGAAHRVTLLVDGTESSHLDLADPAHLEFEYMQQMRVVLDVTRPSGPVRAVHLGAAGCALARALEADRPGSTQLAVELDAVLAERVREWFELPRSPRLRIRVGDARAVLGELRPAAWEVVIRDAFAGGLVPEHLRTHEAAEAAREVLEPGGLYLVNATHRPPRTDARGEAAALREVFGHVVAIADPVVLRGRRYGNLVLAARDRPLDADRIARELRRLPMPARLLDGEQLIRFIAGTSAPRDPVREPEGVAADEGPPGGGG